MHASLTTTHSVQLSRCPSIAGSARCENGCLASVRRRGLFACAHFLLYVATRVADVEGRSGGGAELQETWFRAQGIVYPPPLLAFDVTEALVSVATAFRLVCVQAVY